MYTSILLLALSVAPSADLTSPSWSNDYGMASKESATAKKPLAVVLGTGDAGYNQLDRDGKLTTEAKGLLASKYVCVYVNTESADGKRLAESFRMPSGRGIVISDRTGDLQAFRHEGDLTSTELVRNLERYSDLDRPVVSTETTSTQRTSYYGPGTSLPTAASGYYAPGYAAPGYGAPAYSPGYCPTCSGGGCANGRCGR